MKVNSVQIPLSPEVEVLLSQLPENEKKTLSLIIGAFVTRPTRTISQVMDSMTDYARKQGLKEDDIDGLLKD